MLTIQDMVALPSVGSKDWEDATLENVKENDILTTSDGREDFPSILLRVIKAEPEKERIITKFIGENETRLYPVPKRELRIYHRYKQSADLEYDDAPVKMRICIMLINTDGFIWPCHYEEEEDKATTKACLVLYESEEDAMSSIWQWYNDPTSYEKAHLLNLDTDDRRIVTYEEIKSIIKSKRRG